MEPIGEILEDYMDVLYERWRKSNRRLTDKELLDAFPDIKESLPGEIAGQERDLKYLKHQLAWRLHRLEEAHLPEFDYWFTKESIMQQLGGEIKKLEKNIATNKRLLMISEGKKIEGWIGEDEIRQAQQIPIESLLGIEFKKCGKMLKALCPLHNEKTPSFYIYPETNTCWCFGCQQGGDSIKFVMLLHGFNFKQAVRALLEGNV